MGKDKLTKATAEAGSAKAEATSPTAGAQVSPTRSGEQILEVNGRTPEASFTPQSIFEPIIGFKAIEIDNETILADLLSDKSFRLNPTGTFIWRLILEGLSLEDISKRLSEKFKLDFDRAFEIVSTFVGELVRRNLATLSK